MIGPQQVTSRQAQEHKLLAEVHAVLEAVFTASRYILPWNGGRYCSPGFRLAIVGDRHVLVRYVSGPSVGRYAQRRTAIVMLRRYRSALAASGWRAQIVAEPGKAPYIICADKEPVPGDNDSPAEAQ